MKSSRPIVIALLAGVAGLAMAQGGSSPARKELAQRIVQVQAGAIEGLARSLAEQSVAQLGQQAMAALQARVAPDQREAVARDLQAEFKKYGDEVVPLLRERALKLAPTTVGAVLEEKFTEDELRTLATAMESAAFRKYQQIAPDMQKALVEKLVADARPAIDPKLQALRDTVAKRLGLNDNRPAASAPKSTGAAAARPPASAPRR